MVNSCEFESAYVWENPTCPAFIPGKSKKSSAEPLNCSLRVNLDRRGIDRTAVVSVPTHRTIFAWRFHLKKIRPKAELLRRKRSSHPKRWHVAYHCY
jgi:hypothetical protein